jgi:hypothetical protein
MGFPPRLAGWHACALLVVASTVGRALAVRDVAAPWIAPDEMTYGLIGRDLWEHGHLAILGVESPFYGLVYPALAGLPLALFGTATALDVLQVVQALVLSLTGALVYAWARRLVQPGYALLAAALTLAVPALTYAGLIMTEVAYYPIATAALFTLTAAVERPTLERQSLAAGMILVAALTRLQALALLPVLFAAVLLVAVFERNPRVLRRSAPMLATVAVAVVVMVALRETGSSDVLGAYSTTADASYQLGPALRWILWHAGDAFLLVAGVPLLATVVLLVNALRGREQSPTVRALLAIAVSYTVVTIVQVGLFASRFADVLIERDLLTIAPPLFILFCVWLARGAPRPGRWTLLLCAVTAVPAVLLPVDRLTDPDAEPSSFSVMPFVHVHEWLSENATTAVWVGAVVVVTGLVVLAPGRARFLLPAFTLVALSCSSAVASSDVPRLSKMLRTQLFGSAPPTWIDQASAGRVVYIASGTAYWNSAWLQVFWNRHIDQVVTLPGPAPAGQLPPHTDVSPRFDGTLYSDARTRTDADFVVAPRNLTFFGSPVTSIAQSTDISGLTVWQVERPLRLRSAANGFAPDGDLVGHAQVDVYSCGRGELQVTLIGKEGKPIAFSVDGVVRKTVRPAPEQVLHVAVPAPEYATGDTRCSFGIDTKGRVGTTVVTFVPA